MICSLLDLCTDCCVVSSQNGPELLPRVTMLLLLTRIISTATPRLQVKKGIDDDIVTLMTAVLLSSVMFHTVFQVLAAQCLTALCASAGGGDGCAVAEQPEIDVLLEALLSPCFSVRDAALRVSYSSF